MTQTTRIAINGFGRIGRTILRQLLTSRADAGVEVVLVNDIADLETCAYLFAYDSVFGVFPQPVVQQKQSLTIGKTDIPFTHVSDISTLNLANVDVVLECTGHANTPQIAHHGIDAGARQVLISGPSEAAEVTVVLGANDAALGDAQIVSNGSCTTNALAPIMRILHDALHVEAAHMTTIHCYTGSQPTVDKPGADFARSRAAALSMVPTTTSATKLVKQVLPELKGQLTGAAVRVPMASVSAIDLTAKVRNQTDIQALHKLIDGANQSLIGAIDQPLVSTDLRGRPESLIVALPETMMQTPHDFRLFGWYDNEWGFSARMIDMAIRMAGR